jgi:hypothetical protein
LETEQTAFGSGLLMVTLNLIVTVLPAGRSPKIRVTVSPDIGLSTARLATLL